MSLWNYLKLPEEERYTLWKQARQEQASKNVDELGKAVMDYAHGIGEMHREHGRKTNEEETKAIDLNDSDTQWALSCEAVGSDYWEE